MTDMDTHAGELRLRDGGAFKVNGAILKKGRYIFGKSRQRKRLLDRFHKIPVTYQNRIAADDLNTVNFVAVRN